MEGVGSTRLGSRSSTRHGPTAVFSGPVRRWKKAWIPPVPSSSNPSPLASRLLLYRWTTASGPKDEALQEARPRPRRYLPVSVAIAARHKKEPEAEVEGKPTAENNDQPRAQGSGPILEDLNRTQEVEVGDEVPPQSSSEKSEHATSSQLKPSDDTQMQGQEATPDISLPKPNGLHADMKMQLNAGNFKDPEG